MTRNKTQRILVALEDKREYVLVNEQICDNHIRKIVNCNDNILKGVDSIYDNIIKNKGVSTQELQPILFKLKFQIEELERSLYGKK